MNTLHAGWHDTQNQCRTLLTRTARTRPTNALRFLLVLVGAYLALGALQRAVAEQVTFQPGPEQGIDAYVTNIYESTYEGYKNWIRVGGWGDYYYGLIRFDLTGLPTTANRAVIRLFNICCQASTAMYLDRVTSDWDESVHWATKPTFANVDTLPAPEGGEWYEIDVTDMYNAWQSGSMPNYGIQLRPATGGVPWNVWGQFYSSDFPDDTSLRPQLVVDFDSTPQDQLESLVSMTIGMNLQAGISNALDSKLQNVIDALDRAQGGDSPSAVGMLYAFIQSVEAQADQKITADQADELIQAAQAIIEALEAVSP